MCFGSESEREDEEGIGNSGRLQPDFEAKAAQYDFPKVPISHLFPVRFGCFLGFLWFLLFCQQSEEPIKPTLPFVLERIAFD